MYRSLVSCGLMVLFSTVYAEPTSLMLNHVDQPQMLSLVEALRLAKQSDDVKKAQARVGIADGDALLSTSKLLPKITAKISHEAPTNIPDTRGDAHASLGISTQVPLLDAKSIVDMRSKHESFLAAKTHFHQERNAILYEAGTLYIEAAMAQALTENAREEQEVYRKQVSILERKSKVGSARNLDIRRAQFLAAKAFSEYILKQLDFKKKMGALGEKIERSDNFLLGEITIASVYLEKNAAELVAMAHDAPDVRALSKDLSAAKLSLLSERFDFMPKIYASLDAGWQIPTLSHRLLPSDRFSVRTMLTFEIPIFTGGNTFANLKTAKGRMTIVEVDHRKKLIEKNLAINSVVEEFASLQIVMHNAELAYEAAKLAQESAQRLFNNNEATGLELVEANTNHFSAKNLLANSRWGLERAKLKLLFTVGKMDEILMP